AESFEPDAAASCSALAASTASGRQEVHATYPSARASATARSSVSLPVTWRQLARWYLRRPGTTTTVASSAAGSLVIVADLPPRPPAPVLADRRPLGRLPVVFLLALPPVGPPDALLRAPFADAVRGVGAWPRSMNISTTKHTAEARLATIEA